MKMKQCVVSAELSRNSIQSKVAKKYKRGCYLFTTYLSLFLVTGTVVAEEQFGICFADVKLTGKFFSKTVERKVTWQAENGDLKQSSFNDIPYNVSPIYTDNIGNTGFILTYTDSAGANNAWSVSMRNAASHKGRMSFALEDKLQNTWIPFVNVPALCFVATSAGALKAQVRNYHLQNNG